MGEQDIFSHLRLTRTRLIFACIAAGGCSLLSSRTLGAYGTVLAGVLVSDRKLAGRANTDYRTISLTRRS